VRRRPVASAKPIDIKFEDREYIELVMTPLRILHVVGSWGRGGTETWLMHVLKNMDPDRFRMHFLIHTADPSAYDRLVSQRGGRLIPCLTSARPWAYGRQFTRILKEHGPYDVVHSHVHHFSGYVLRLAYRAGVPHRIAHSHCDTSYEDNAASWGRRSYVAMMRAAISRYATCGIAASDSAGQALYGRTWRRDLRWRVLYCGIDLQPFRELVDQAAIRAELGIPRDASVIGHVGGFRPPKNHAFLIRVAACLLSQVPDLFVLLVGDGPLRSHIELEAAAAGIGKRVIFAGLSDNVRRLLAAMDLFIFPSFGEGLGLAVLEAQAAGIPCLLSDVITKEVDVIPQLISRRSLALPASAWARTIATLLRNRPSVPLEHAVALLERSSFNSTISTGRLEDLYASLQIHSSDQALTSLSV
jgi:glycosyltransferase involved in cell wall biosynthesis